MDAERLRAVLMRHHSFRNGGDGTERVRCYCGAVIGEASYFHAPALGKWTDHILAILAEPER